MPEARGWLASLEHIALLKYHFSIVAECTDITSLDTLSPYLSWLMAPSLDANGIVVVLN